MSSASERRHDGSSCMAWLANSLPAWMRLWSVSVTVPVPVFVFVFLSVMLEPMRKNVAVASLALRI